MTWTRQQRQKARMSMFVAKQTELVLPSWEGLRTKMRDFADRYPDSWIAQWAAEEADDDPYYVGD